MLAKTKQTCASSPRHHRPHSSNPDPTAEIACGEKCGLVSLNTADLAPAAAVYAFRLVGPGEALRAMRHLEV